MNRDWSIASQKATAAIVEGLAFDVIRDFYARQGLKVSRIDYNSALDLTGKQKFDLVDTFGKKWEVKADKQFWHTGNAFIEHLKHSDFDYLLDFLFFPAIISVQQYLQIISNPRYRVTSSHEAFNQGSLVPYGEMWEMSLYK